MEVCCKHVTLESEERYRLAHPMDVGRSFVNTVVRFRGIC